MKIYFDKLTKKIYEFTISSRMSVLVIKVRESNEKSVEVTFDKEGMSEPFI